MLSSYSYLKTAIDDKQPDCGFYFFPNFQVPEKDKPSQGSWQDAFESISTLSSNQTNILFKKVKPYLFSRMNANQENQNRATNRNNSREHAETDRFMDNEEILEEFTAKKQF